jgi:PPOX class probable F420-dependent enzyme
MNKSEAHEFLSQHNIMVLSTLHEDGSPQSAVVACGVTPELDLVLNTQKTTRKYQNLQRDPRVSVVIGWDDRTTIQLEGKAAELQSGPELEAAQEAYFAKHPWAKEMAGNPAIAFIKITPHWARYTDINHWPWESKEITL